MTVETALVSDYTPHILVVDDEERIREACRVVLEQAGYHVDLAGDGTTGLKMIEEHHYDIILLDLMMPALSGFDVLAMIKNRHPEAVVIIITGYATLEHSIESMKKGAFDFIPKPFTPDHLRVMVAKAIDYTRALRDISDTRSRLRTLVNCLSDGVMCINRQNRVVLANPAFLKMAGSGGSESAVGRPMAEVVDNEQIIALIDEAMALDAAGAATELAGEVSLRNGGELGEKILSVRCMPFNDGAGNHIGLITVLHDITALKLMDRMKSEFVSMVSHEIRGPMNAVMMQLKVVLDGLAGETTPKQDEILGRASEKIKNLVQMASELLDLARIESGLISQEREQVDLAEIIKEQIEFNRARATAASLRLELLTEGPLPHVFANRRNMEEVVSNLLTNAIKYTPEGGSIHVSAAPEGDYICICVKDTGYGISEEDQQHIFERFYRVKDRQTRFIHGTGLGLALVKSIVDSHQGRIEVQSRPGKGSTFVVYLPVFTP